LDEVLIDRVLKAWDETRVDHWLHALAKPDALHHHGRMIHRALGDLHGDVRDWVPMVLIQKVSMKMKKVAKMKGDRRKRDGWMDGQNLGDQNHGEVVSHPFRSPLFKFSFNLRTSLILLFIHGGK
jgi:hypothetical protein